MVQAILNAKEKVVGLKQTVRALEAGRAKKVFYAADTEEHIVKRLASLCKEKGVSFQAVEVCQKELGRVCQIDVGAAIVAIVED
ncbi:MAG TPA: 50S ribosomal protein L7Ae-like protein [Firmicutes bacterium]|jgi:large subunit ribosomal protein L7A|nr:50S ribosomal protein L7Ae-like protein [Bacillota bacterium]HPT67362.1 ribosomal L7Ae/L30e/S12e/Gadd45 family protein [Bacillota bacterium]